MAIEYILDGYNIIKSDESGVLTKGSLQEQRERFISLLNETHPQGSKRNRLVIVFDGPYDAPYSGNFPRFFSGFVEVIFSEGVSADERIERLIREETHAPETVVVSDDRGLRRMLGGSGVQFMSVAEFTKRMKKGSRANSGSNARANHDESMQHIDRELKKHWLK